MKKQKTLSINRYAVYMILGMAVILTIGALLIAFYFFDRSATEIYEEMDRSITGAALNLVDQNEMDELAKQTMAIYNSMDDPIREFNENYDAYIAKFSSIQESEEYQNIREAINDMRRDTAASAICYVLLVPGVDTGVFIIDASDSNVMPCGEQFEIETDYYLNNPGRKFESYISSSEKWGLVRTDGVPTYADPSQNLYSYLAADIPITNVVNKGRSFLINSGLSALILTILICFIVSRILNHSIVATLRNVTNTSKNYVDTCRNKENRGDTEIFRSLSNGGITEFEELNSALRNMESDMNDYHRNLAKMTAERTRLSAELDLANSIQSNMLPTIFPAFPERDEFDIYALMDPAREVGGDFYDFFLIDNDTLGMVIADVSGKGIPAALFMMMAKILIKNYAQYKMSPKQVLETVNNTICQNNDNDMFVTVWLGFLHISTGKIVCSNAGHEYPIIRRAGGKFEVIKDRHGFVVGTLPDMKYREYEIEFHTGDTLFVYTDGLPEAINSAYEQFGIDRVVDVLNEDPDADVEDIFLNVSSAVAEFIGDAPQHDDLTMLVLKGKDIGSAADSTQSNAKQTEQSA